MAKRLFESDIDLNKFQLLNAVIQVLGTAPSTPTTGQVYYSSAANTFYGWNGTSWLDLGSGGPGVTDLTFSRDGTSVTVISSTGTDAVLPAATTSLAGVMTSTDKTKLDGIESGAQVNVGTNLAEGTRTNTTVPITSSTGTSATLNVATTTVAGVMSAADKTKLDGIEAGAKDDQNASEVPFDNTATGFAATNVQSAINEAKTYTDNLATGALINKGGYNASTNSPDLDTTPITGIKNGWTYVITAAGTFFTEAVQVGDMIIAKQDSPTSLAHWTVVNKNIPDIVNASESDAGLVEEATDAEVTAGTNTGGSGAKLFITPGKLQTYLNTATSGLTNAVKYTTTIGDNSATTIAVTHNIGKQFNTVQVFQTSSPFSQIECEVRATSTTQTTFVFNTAPTTNQYTVVITG